MTGRMPRFVGLLAVLIAIVGVLIGEMMYRSVYREFHLCGRALELLSVCIGMYGICLIFPGRSVCILVWVVGSILTFLVLFAPPLLVRSPSAGYRLVCKENLSQIGKAIYAYSQNNEGYMPYDERGPLYSLVLLYPEYVDSPKLFQCPYVHATWAKRNLGVQFPADSALAGERCHYGYTWRSDLNPPLDFAIMADMPENHVERGGYNVLYSDGGLIWQSAPFCSHDTNDNIFAREPGWSSDTDSFIRLE